jgi:thiol-disulfide isomerase/thioredoxin
MSNIQNLNATDFFVRNNQVYINTPLLNNKPFMLLVWANYCGYCHQFMPDYKSLSLQTTRFNFFAIEAKELDKKKEIGKTLNINGYPTILFGNTKGLIAEDYQGNRDITSLVKKIKAVCKYCI